MLVGLNVESPKVSENIMEIIKDAAAHLKGSRRRIFMAKTVNAFGKGGQRKLERVLNWSRKTIRKGQFELENGLVLVDNF